jgi:DNA primase large subunit
VTLEPLEGLIEHPGVVRLLEVPEPTKDEGLSMPKASKHQHQSGQDMDFDPCMYGVIKDKVPLEGSEGHEMRLAIAIKADQFGLDAETTACIFCDQPDFNLEISLGKVLETWRYWYKPYSCKTLQDKCGGLVKPYCEKCRRCSA